MKRRRKEKSQEGQKGLSLRKKMSLEIPGVNKVLMKEVRPGEMRKGEQVTYILS